MLRETIRNHSGRVIGYLEMLFNGDIIAKDHSGRYLGRYDKASNTTKDHTGRTIYRGNMVSALLD